MAGSSITNPRKSGSFKRLQGISGNGGLNQGSGVGTAGQRAPAPSKAAAPPGMVDPTRPQTSNAQVKTINDQGSRNVAAAKYQESLRGRVAAGGMMRSPQQIGFATYTPDAPVQGRGAAAAPPTVNNQTAGSGMVRNLNEQRGGDRTGVEVTGAGGTPIRVDNNQAIQGAATVEQQQQVRTQDPNFIYYQNPQVSAPVPSEPLPALEKNVSAEQGIGTFDSMGNRVSTPTRDSNLTLNVTEEERQATLNGNSGSGINTSANGLRGNGNIVTSTSALTAEPTQPTAQTTTSSTNERYPNPGGIFGPVWDKLSDQQKANVLGLNKYADEQAKFNEYVPNSYDNDAREGSGLSRATGGKSEDVLHTANEVASAYNISPEKARYLLDKGYVFWGDGGRVETPSGTSYTGTEVPGMFSDNPTVQGNAQEGADDLAIFEKNKATDEAEEDLAAKEEMNAADRAKVEDLLNKPTDVSGVTSAYDKSIEASRQAAARNKALALRGMQERGAYSGASVNQMMGQNTEAGYAYDTEAQQQEAMLTLQKEMAIANAEKSDADRKLSWAVALYQGSANKAEADANWLKVQKWQGISDAANERRARAEAEANSPGIGAYLAAGGIGVAGALGSIFSGGATGVAALGAISSILGSAGAMYGMSRGSNVQMPATNFNYQSAPGTTDQDTSNNAPGYRDLSMFS